MAQQNPNWTINGSFICRFIALIIFALICLGLPIPFGGFVLGLFFWLLSTFI